MRLAPAPETPAPVLCVRRLPGSALRPPLELRPGEMLAAQIASRVKREALLAWLAGDAPAEADSVVLLGNDLAVTHRAARAGTLPPVAFVPRDGGLFSNLNAWENIWTPVTYHRPEAGSDLAWRVHVLLQRLDVDPPAIAARRPAELTPLERRLVAFVRAVSLRPELIVLESLFDDLDAGESTRAARVFEVFRGFLPFRSLLAVGTTFPHLAMQARPRLLRIEDE